MENAVCLLHLAHVLEGVETHLTEAGFETNAADLTDYMGHRMMLSFKTEEGFVSTIFGLGDGLHEYEILGGVAFYSGKSPNSGPERVEPVTWTCCVCELPSDVGTEIGAELVGWVLARYRPGYWEDDAEDGPHPQIPPAQEPSDTQAFSE
jgi:hypothetical protein